LMIAISCAVLAAQLTAVAVAVSSPVGDLGIRALLSPFQPRGSDLHTRQSEQFVVPDQCLPICDPTITVLNDCPDVKCQCTSQNVNALYQCVECCVIADAAVSQSSQDAQAALTGFLNNCNSYGITLAVPPVTLPPPPPVTVTAPAANPTTTIPIGNPPFTPGFGASSSSTSSFIASTSYDVEGGITAGKVTTVPPVTSPSPAASSSPISKNGAIGVRDRVGVMSMLFSLCLVVVLLV